MMILYQKNTNAQDDDTWLRPPCHSWDTPGTLPLELPQGCGCSLPWPNALSGDFCITPSISYRFLMKSPLQKAVPLLPSPSTFTPLTCNLFLHLFHLSYYIFTCLLYFLFSPTQWTLCESRVFIFSMLYPQPLKQCWPIIGVQYIFIEWMNNEWINRTRMNEHKLIIKER